MVYKVCEFRGLPRIKISEEAEKTTIPASKKVARAFNDQNQPIFDVLFLSEENVPDKDIKVYNRFTGQVFTAPRLLLLTQLLFSQGKSALSNEEKTMKIQREELQDKISLFGGLEGLIENKDKY